MRILTIAIILVVVISTFSLAEEAKPAAEPEKTHRFFSHGSGIRDGGPIYVETNNYMNSNDKGLIWEPFNAGSALIFAVVAIFWLIKIRGKEEALFFQVCMVVLLIGGLGGTLYHALRSSPWFLMMDVMPILILFVLSVGWIIARLNVKRCLAWLLAIGGFIGTLAFYALLRFLDLTVLGPSMGYLMIGVYILVPYTIYALRTQKESIIYLICAVLLFLTAYIARSIDLIVDIPMGTHFLWHTFGAMATASLTNYLWRTRLINPVSP